MTSDVEWKDSESTMIAQLRRLNKPNSSCVDIPEVDWTIRKPAFFGGAVRDYNCIPAFMRAPFYKYAPNFTFQDYDSGHWIMMQRPEEMNKDLLGWIEGIVL